MRLFFDTEFTELTQSAELISLAFVDESGRSFYAEFSERFGESVEPWVYDNVISHTKWLSKSQKEPSLWLSEGARLSGFDNKEAIANRLGEWLSFYERVELWADCPAYDWVLICELFGGSLSLPKPLSYVVNDFATMLTLKGYDPLIPRESLLQKSDLPSGQLHNALYDAQLLKLCFERLSSAQ